MRTTKILCSGCLHRVKDDKGEVGYVDVPSGALLSMGRSLLSNDHNQHKGPSRNLPCF